MKPRSFAMTSRVSPTRLLAFAGAATLATVLALPSPAAAQSRVRVGVLTCNVDPGVGFIVASQRDMTCLFRPDGRGRREGYVGRITRVGLDVGVTGRGVLAWTVFAPTRVYSPSQLAGNYAGASAQATLAVGLGANVLVGGSRDTVALQPLSVQAQTGVNLALGVGNLALRRARLRGA
jgi:hypothetical protein